MEPAHKRVDEMTPEERLQSLQQWAEEQKYVRPGEGGTLPFGVGQLAFGGIRRQSYSGPVRYVEPQYSAPIAPPSYETATGENSKDSSKKAGPLKRFLEKRKEKKAERSKSIA